jgi:hypothetical protein
MIKCKHLNFVSYVHYVCFRGDSSPADDINSGVPAEHNGLTDYGKVSRSTKCSTQHCVLGFCSLLRMRD